ncbi:ArsR/SmtB family transcription factor [Pararhodobacter oceanensis]|uniref:ArsR/SmtB family transcription factor n=1 Tax=Pararhodobacter oceanensis TaxID=2172121 RepID=UPI003A906253
MLNSDTTTGATTDHATGNAEIARQFAALGDPIRFAIIDRLAREGEVPAGALSEGFAVSAPAVSRHLGVLHKAGLVQRRVEGQRRLYSVAPESMRRIALWTLSHRAFWQGSLSRLDALIALEEHSDD